MPVTPFHFGVGLLGKGLAPARVSVAAFVASQVVIDLESAYYLFVAPSAHVHRWMHTLVVAIPLGALVGLAVWRAAAALRLSEPGSEWSPGAALAGGLLGGVTHPLLDAVMHADVQPFLPFATGNPLWRLVGLGPLHLACVLAGAIGAALLLFRSRIR